MSAESTTSPHILHDLIKFAREQLLVVQTYSPECSPGSPAQLAFDPYIARRLQMFTPIRVIPPPDLQKTCDAFRRFLDGLDEINLLKDTDELLTWEVSCYFFASPVAGSFFLNRLWVIYDYGQPILLYGCHTCGPWLRSVLDR